MTGGALPQPTVGMIGGGQLARMTHQAAIALGVRLVVLCPDDDAPAVQAGARRVPGRADHLDDLVALAEQVDVVTLDHERTPVDLLHELVALGHDVAPRPEAARLGRDKIAARTELSTHGIPVAPWAPAHDVVAVETFAEVHGWPLILKASTGGYDGRGVWRVDEPEQISRLLTDAPGPFLVEPALRFSQELSVLVARTVVGGNPQTVVYPPVETVQQDGQCVEVRAPARSPVAGAARDLAASVAEVIGLVGVMAVELFVVDGGLVLNELALRPHNSGHLTIEACVTSQFENHLRAVLGLPLGSGDLRVGGASMRNVLGPADGTDPFAGLPDALAETGVSVHRYAKAPRPGRKVGHLTATAATVEEARAATARALAALAPDGPPVATEGSAA